MANGQSLARRVVVRAVGVRVETVGPGAFLALTPERRPHRADKVARAILMNTGNPSADKAKRFSHLVGVLREVMPAAFAVDIPRREPVNELGALVVLIEEDGRALYVNDTLEGFGDFVDAVDGHGFLLLVTLPPHFFFWPEFPRFRRRGQKKTHRTTSDFRT